MKSGRILLIAGLLWAGCCSGSLAQLLTPEQTHADLSYLKRKLDLLHPGMGYYTPQPRMERLYDSLYNQLTSPVSYPVFFHHISPLIAALKDGHTNLNHRRSFINRSTRYLPFYIRTVDSLYYITHNVSSDTSLRRGTELCTINGKPVGDIHRALMEADHSGSDGNNLTGRRWWSLIQFADYYAAWYGSADSVSVTYRLPNDTLVREIRLKCPNLHDFRVTMRSRYKNEIHRDENLTVRTVDTLTRTAVLRVSSFMGLRKRDPFQLTYKRRLRQVFQQIKTDRIENLIVDMQSNGGGIVLNSARLLQYWMPKPFRMMEREEMKSAVRTELITRWNPLSALNFSLRYKSTGGDGFASRSGSHKYRPIHKDAFRGKLYFMLNGASFSAATTVLAKTLDAGMGTFVGEASGSAYWGDFAGQFRTITLPNSRMQVRIPLKKMVHAVGKQHANGFTVEPDFAVSRTLNDILTNRDYVLDYTLRLIRDGVIARQPIVNQPLQASR